MPAITISPDKHMLAATSLDNQVREVPIAALVPLDSCPLPRGIPP